MSRSRDRRRPTREPPRALDAIMVAYGAERFTVLSFEPMQEGVDLTRAEQAILEHIVRGRTNEKIAEARGTSVRTVANQITSIMKKTGARSRLELVWRAYGVPIEPESPR